MSGQQLPTLAAEGSPLATTKLRDNPHFRGLAAGFGQEGWWHLDCAVPSDEDGNGGNGHNVSMTQPKNWKLYLEFPLAIGIFMLASLNLAYRPLWLITTVSVILLTACSYYFKLRHHVHLPLVVLFLAFAAVEIDTVGNHFRWYQKFPWPVPYDVFAHFTIPLLVAPALFWLIQLWFAQQGNQLPLSSIAFVTINVMFSLSAFYEITEMWDELYFGGHRIWTLHDTTRDLQWDLLGTIVGSLLTYAVLKVRQPARSPTTKSSTWPKSHKNPQQLREIPHHQLSRPR